jgi:hypothetical protein
MAAGACNVLVGLNGFWKFFRGRCGRTRGCRGVELLWKTAVGSWGVWVYVPHASSPGMS